MENSEKRLWVSPVLTHLSGSMVNGGANTNFTEGAGGHIQKSAAFTVSVMCNPMTSVTIFNVPMGNMSFKITSVAPATCIPAAGAGAPTS